jgi:hypothetical protein
MERDALLSSQLLAGWLSQLMMDNKILLNIHTHAYSTTHEEIKLIDFFISLKTLMLMLMMMMRFFVSFAIPITK